MLIFAGCILIFYFFFHSPSPARYLSWLISNKILILQLILETLMQKQINPTVKPHIILNFSRRRIFINPSQIRVSEEYAENSFSILIRIKNFKDSSIKLSFLPKINYKEIWKLKVFITAQIHERGFLTKYKLKNCKLCKWQNFIFQMWMLIAYAKKIKLNFILKINIKELKISLDFKLQSPILKMRIKCTSVNI